MRTLPEQFGDTYHPQTAWWMAQLSHWAYLSPGQTEEQWQESTREKLLAAGFQAVQFFDDMQAFIAIHRNYQILVVRGSDDIEDWVRNLTTRKITWYRGEVHAGFSGLSGELSRVLYTVATISAPMYITGHSLGGAVSMLCAAELERQGLGRLIHGIYTFGQPRVGDCDFVDFYEPRLGSRTFRHVHCADAVPRLPGMMPRWVRALILAGSVWVPILALIALWPAGFEHAGIQFYTDRDGEVHLNTSWWFRLWDRLVGTYHGLREFRVPAISHHSQGESYLRVLTEQLERLEAERKDQ